MLRPLSLGELLDRAFVLYRRHFVLFFGLAAVPNLLTLAVQLVAAATITDPFVTILVMLPQLVLTFLINAVVQASTVHAVAELHLNRPATIADSLRIVPSRFGPLLILTFIQGLLIGVGAIFLIIPGVLIALRYAVAVPAMVIERPTVWGAMERSADLMQGAWGRVFVIFILFFVVSMTLAVIVMMPTLIYTIMSGGSPEQTNVTVRVLSDVLSYLTSALVAPLVTIAIALVYFDQRVRREAFDLQHMLASLGPASAPLAPPAPQSGT